MPNDNNTLPRPANAEQITARRRRLEAAIRTFTVDAKNTDGEEVPNGPTEAALEKLLDAIDPALGLGALVADWLERSADDLAELEEAAAAHFGGDFSASSTPATKGSGSKTPS